MGRRWTWIVPNAKNKNEINYVVINGRSEGRHHSAFFQHEKRPPHVRAKIHMIFAAEKRVIIALNVLNVSRQRKGPSEIHKDLL